MAEDQTVHPDADRFGGWFWREPFRGEHFRRCGFCGSIHPDDLAAETDWLAHWADQKYGWPHKFYVDVVNREPEALFATSSTWNTRGKSGHGEVAWDDLTPEQRALYDRDHGMAPDRGHPASVGFGTRAVHNAKFYTIHLSDPAIDEAVKVTIEQRSGVHFTFADGRVTWGAVR